VLELLAELRPDAVAIVDAFGFSDAVLQSTIGRADGGAYEALYATALRSPLNDPRFQQQLWREHLSGVVDLDMLREGERTQTGGAVASAASTSAGTTPRSRM
jgi:hypothetical protein